MQSFKFRLQPVLDLKEQEKDTIQQRYQKAREGQKKREEDLQVLQDKKNFCLSSLEIDAEKKINPFERKLNWSFIESLNLEIEEVTGDVERLEGISRKRFLELVEKMREEKSLEKLKENLYEAHRIKQERAHQKEIDEIGQRLFNLPKGEEN